MTRLLRIFCPTLKKWSGGLLRNLAKPPVWKTIRLRLLNTRATHNGTRTRRAIFHVAPFRRVPTLENRAGNLTPCGHTE